MMKLDIQVTKISGELVIEDLNPDDVFCFVDEFLALLARFKNGEKRVFEDLSLYLRTDSDNSIVCLDDGGVYPIIDEKTNWTNRAIKIINVTTNAKIEI